MTYFDVYKSWKEDPETFWMEAAKAVDWKKFPLQALDKSNPPFYRWFCDGLANTCYNAVDRHVISGLGNKTAIIYDSPVTGRKEYMKRKILRVVSTIHSFAKGFQNSDCLITNQTCSWFSSAKYD